ncbi:serine/threonine-protein kinase [Streptomyces lavenduligriseus]|uniref:non-specific serine/threonine protein kinase n=1 Tax=Streptomyces lavenduligriseus TaxID=67315 RepID=A0ABT0NR45_9ACTN|nr:serine/threonine-protein kinase [Streptomyces lavenduligriseus]MCL3993773.1 serine/threonine protein kinase [Streptomyces lavenduligriseus]
MNSYEEVVRLARGQRADYACDKIPMRGGQADVFKAVHKPSGVTVALKRLRVPRRQRVERMAREIEVGRLLGDHPDAMPILDADPGNTWFVMPYAEQTAEGLSDTLRTDAALHELLVAVCSVLAIAHAKGWVHRDIKPSNILLLDGRWVVADWGIARGPRGGTPDPQLTRVGMSIGSQGFAAPELSDDAHSAGPQADIYSLGQVIGWWLTGRPPRANRAHIPERGPWRTVVRAATREDPGKRPSGTNEFLALVERETSLIPKPASLHLSSLRRELNHGSLDAAEALVSLADAHIDDAKLYCDFLVDLDEEKLLPALLADTQRAIEVVRAMAVLTGAERPPTTAEIDTTVLWLFTVARRAAQVRQMPLFEECLDSMLSLDAQWNARFAQQRILRWLRTVAGDTASSAADMLQNHPESAIHFVDLMTDTQTDRRIRSALSDTIAAGTVNVLSPLASSGDGKRSGTQAVTRVARREGAAPHPGEQLPEEVVTQLVTTLYRQADAIHWHLLDARDRSKYIDSWLRDPSVGGILRNYLPAAQARTWLKDVPLHYLAPAQEGFGPFSRYVVRGYRGAEEVVEAAFGSGWCVLPGSVTNKPMRCYASSGESTAFVVWGRPRDLRNLVWFALNEGAKAPYEAPSPVVVLTADHAEPVRYNDRVSQHKLAERSGIQLVHLRRKMAPRCPPLP